MPSVIHITTNLLIFTAISGLIKLFLNNAYLAYRVAVRYSMLLVAVIQARILISVCTT